MNETDIMLTVLTIFTGVLAIVTFFNNRKKDNHTDGEADGKLQSDLNYIKATLQEIKSNTHEISKQLDNHSIAIAEAKQSLKSAHKRIDEALVRIDALEKTNKGA